MSIELTQAAQQALDAFDAFGDADDFASLFALTKKMNALRDTLSQQHATQPADVPDDQILTEAARHLGEMHVENCGLSDIKDFARAILALRPVQVPMTEKQIGECIDEVMLTSSYGTHHFGWAIELARAIEAHHGITAQAKKG